MDPLTFICTETRRRALYEVHIAGRRCNSSYRRAIRESREEFGDDIEGLEFAEIMIDNHYRRILITSVFRFCDRFHAPFQSEADAGTWERDRRYALTLAMRAVSVASFCDTCIFTNMLLVRISFVETFIQHYASGLMQRTSVWQHERTNSSYEFFSFSLFKSIVPSCTCNPRFMISTSYPDARSAIKNT